jgi:hypothetical protein
MGGVTMNEFDYADVQGLVRFGYKKMTKASYALLRVKDVAAARAWLRSAPVTSAVEMKPPPPTALHVAFTAPGLRGCLKSPDSRQILSSMCSLQLPESWREARTTSVNLALAGLFKHPLKLLSPKKQRDFPEQPENSAATT